MFRFLVLILALCSLAAPAIAAGEVPNGSTWVSGTTVVTFRVSDRATDVLISPENASGSGPAVPGNAGPNSAPGSPTCDGSGEMTTPDGKTVRVNPITGLPEYKNRSGGWSRMRQVKQKRRMAGPGDDITGVPGG